MKCLFCAIVSGEIPADIVKQSDNVLAFNDINPIAPTHVLVIPKIHYENAAELTLANSEVLVECFEMAASIANERELNGYRTLFNTGADGGQSVFHAHLHLLGGRALSWPPG
ncbi:MAG: histidine triad nucleotide-binding protein [Actinobacteria bacterium]|nr:histidine triad nucleotide-binding protein [Actinomycetota bacterium]NBO47147.1 histidine triad nucleotide-binding protein [Actinomycetota bacterium]NBP11954.1 histidine triad nucleotide-binding protein [Actinomycetota bacterium]NBP22319.1 histidine triad nucleotide-binding protein [Actinomycetota bacterium]NBP42755.1 histidine triad nucleotide-binding protein [Actinomycetota bacterium]